MSWRRIRRRFRIVPPIALAVVASVLIAAGASAQTAHAPAWTAATDTIAPGVTIGGVPVAGLTSSAAMDAVTAAFDQPVSVTLAAKTYTEPTAALGQTIFAQAAVGQAMAIGRTTPVPASGAANVSLRITVRSGGLQKWIASVTASVLHPAVNASTVLGKNAVPKVTRSADGYELVGAKLQALVKPQLLRANAAHALGTRTSLLRVLHASVTTKQLPDAIVIHRGANRLYLYSPTKLVKIYKVATGQAIYPTPLGHFTIVTKQKDPWWYPPTQDAWAQGLKPVPPGPDNPLGTRWMGLSVPGVGIHGTDAPSSIGYSESHGCVRMQIPDAEQVFAQVSVGTPVFIVK